MLASPASVASASSGYQLLVRALAVKIGISGRLEPSRACGGVDSLKDRTLIFGFCVLLLFLLERTVSSKSFYAS